MLSFNTLLRPTSVEEAFEMATKYKFAPLLAGTCWTRLGRRIHPIAIDL
ncbi:MAG: FAD-binding protein, partial [Veillonella sp.]|nr:FAD-binding protein [Veillonella sp.]